MTALSLSSHHRAPLFAASLMVIVAVIAALDSVLVRLLSPSVHPFVMAFTRALFGLLVVLPWLGFRPAVLQSHYRFRHVLRAVLKLAALITFFIAFATAPLADVTAIAFTTPLFVTVGAWLLLGEKPRVWRIFAVLLAFAGVLLVIRPDRTAGISSGLMFALLGAVLVAAIQLILKPMSARDSTETLVTWNLIITVPIAAIPAMLVWATPNGWEWALLAVQGLLGALAMTLATRAFALAEASFIVPFDFIRLPVVALLGYLFFAEAVALSTWLGGVLIFGGILLMTQGRTKDRAQTLPKPAAN